MKWKRYMLLGLSLGLLATGCSSGQPADTAAEPTEQPGDEEEAEAELEPSVEVGDTVRMEAKDQPMHGEEVVGFWLRAQESFEAPLKEEPHEDAQVVDHLAIEAGDRFEEAEDSVLIFEVDTVEVKAGTSLSTYDDELALQAGEPVGFATYFIGYEDISRDWVWYDGQTYRIDFLMGFREWVDLDALPEDGDDAADWDEWWLKLEGPEQAGWLRVDIDEFSAGQQQL